MLHSIWRIENVLGRNSECRGKLSAGKFDHRPSYPPSASYTDTMHVETVVPVETPRLYRILETRVWLGKINTSSLRQVSWPPPAPTTSSLQPSSLPSTGNFCRASACPEKVSPSKNTCVFCAGWYTRTLVSDAGSITFDTSVSRAVVPYSSVLGPKALPFRISGQFKSNGALGTQVLPSTSSAVNAHACDIHFVSKNTCATFACTADIL